MKSKDLSNQITELLVTRMGLSADNIQPNAKLQDELGLDSLDAVDLLNAVNETFRTRLPASAMDQVDTVQDLITLVENNQK